VDFATIVVNSDGPSEMTADMVICDLPSVMKVGMRMLLAVIGAQPVIKTLVRCLLEARAMGFWKN
jgi:hypothetical protein